jgi:hypothetical protein
MSKVIEAVIEPDGRVRLLEPVTIGAARRALVTVLDEAPSDLDPSVTGYAENALAEDWMRPDEDEAWSHLQPAR